MFKPDYRNLVDCAENREPARTPLYEHNISDKIMEKISGKRFSHLLDGSEKDLDGYFREYCAFFMDHGYDTVTYEACVTDVLPYGGALAHPQPGYIDSREKFESYPFSDVKELYRQKFGERFDALSRQMPDGMKAVGGVGNGIFETVQDLVGYENLCILSFEDPELYADLFVKVGDMLLEIWQWFLSKYGDIYCVVRFGDDLGYKSNTMLSHDDIRTHIVPQYKRIISLAHSFKKPFLLHSCGCIFEVMDDLIAAGVDAKHSNEDQISDFREWVTRYGDRIGNFGGVDTDHLVRLEPEKLETLVTRLLDDCARGHGGFAIGSGNSIPEYVDPERYLVMVNTVRKWRGDEL